MPWELTGNSGTNPATNFLGTTDRQPLVIQINTREALRIDPNSNVGIGTATPGSKLHIDVPASAAPISAFSLDVQSFGTDANARASHFLQVRDIGAAPPNGVTHFYIRGDGSIGIGTATPGSKLHIDVPASAAPISAFSLDVQSFGTDANARASHFLQVRDIGAAPPNGVTHFYIRGDGNVGIGTATPGEKLTITGRVQSTTGGFVFPDGSVQTTATLRGPQGPKGDKGYKGDKGDKGDSGPAVRTSAICADPTIIANGSCNCPGGRLISRVSGPCTVTADTGNCSAQAFRDPTSGIVFRGECCVCAP